MRMYDVIEKKKRGEALTHDEIYSFIKEYTAGNIPDYQTSALMMAIYFKGMNAEETAYLTDAMAISGDTVDLSMFAALTEEELSLFSALLLRVQEGLRYEDVKGDFE